MPLDPQAKAFLDQIEALGGPALSAMPVADARQLMEAMASMRAVAPPVLASVADRRLPGPGGEIPVRVYTPAGSGPLPAGV